MTTPACTAAAVTPMRLLLVRVWSGPEGFRASLRSVEDDEARLFTEPALLAGYLAALAAAPATQHEQAGGKS